MKLISRIAFAMALVVAAVAVGTGSDDEDPESTQQPQSQRGESPDAGPVGFADSNWDRTAEPGALRRHQRIDPATGKPLVLSNEQAAVSNDDGMSAIERDTASEMRKRDPVQVSYGDPDAETKAVR